MVIEFLLTSLFIFANFNPNLNTANSFVEKAKYNYAMFQRNQDKAEYNQRYVDLLYENNFINNKTSITVLTHGIGGNSDYWFPKKIGNLSKPDYSSSESIANMIISYTDYDAENIPILSFAPKTANLSTNDVNLKQLTYDQTTEEYNFLPFEFDTNESVCSLLRKHIILIYDQSDYIAETGYESNDEMSLYFCRALDSVLAKMSVFYQGKLPRINLIGHSRGGLLNMRYAFLRENLVDNFITIGSPYTGSIWAKTLNSLCKIGRLFDSNNTFFNSNIYDGVLGDDPYASYSYIQNISHAYTVAIGCETDPALLCGQILNASGLIETMNLSEVTFGNDNLIWKVLNKIYQDLVNSQSFVLGTLRTLASGLKSLANFNLSLITINDFVDNLHSLFPNYQSILNDPNYENLHDYAIEFLNDVKDLCDNVLDYDTSNGCIRTDFCVDLYSQIGTDLDYLLNQRITIPCIQGTGCFQDKYLSNAELPHVTHNYESNMPAVTSNIISILTNRSSIQTASVVSSGTVFTISPYRVPAYCLSISDQQLYYPIAYFFGDEFDFIDYYYYEHEIRNNNSLMYKNATINGIEINTRRMRTGFIQNERIVLSPNRRNAGLAFLEFSFSEPVHYMSFKLSLWSINEIQPNSNLTFFHTYDEDLKDFISGENIFTNNFSLEDYPTMTSRGQLALLGNDPYVISEIDYVAHNFSDIPKNRNKPVEYEINASDGFTFIGFYVACNVTSTQNNRGRVCLSDFIIIS